MAGASVIAHVLVSKFCDHTPLYRQAQIYARDGVEIPRSTQSEWVGQATTLLNPLVEAVVRYVLGGSKVHGDDTPVPVLCPGRGTTKMGRLWVYVRDDRNSGGTTPPAVASDTRRTEKPFIQTNIWNPSAAFCRLMHMLVITAFTIGP